MNLVLNIYTNDELTELKRKAEADRLKIPYRVAIELIKSLEGVNLDDNDEIINFAGKSIDKLDKVIKATFKVSDAELECVDIAELGTVAKDLYSWIADKLKSIKGDKGKNLQETALNI